MKRVILIVLDSAGVGELPDAHLYGDVGSNTICNISSQIGGLSLPNMEKLGLGNIEGMKNINKVSSAIGSYGKLAEQSAGKDTTTGHWEISGIKLPKAFPSYPNGFSKEIISEFEKLIGTKTLGNYPASGTEIIKDLGDEHVKTGYPIVYTSADSVFQIAAHESVIKIERLYELCEIARKLLVGEHAVGRVIARPFEGESNNFNRTDRRHDFSLKPIANTMLDSLKENGYEVKAVGKINDIFCGVGITDSVHTHGNMDGVDKTLEYMKETFEGLIFTNLVDFDMQYGHRNDVKGYAKALIEFDNRLPEIINSLEDDDILMLTADHGCDPTMPGTDHSREYIPLLIYGKKIKSNVNLKIRDSYSDIGATILDYFKLNISINGSSFLEQII